MLHVCIELFVVVIRPVQCVNEAIRQLDTAADKIRLHNIESAVPFFSSIVCLILNAISRLDEENQQLADNACSRLTASLTHWMERVVGMQFGNGFKIMYRRTYELRKPFQEFKVHMYM